MGSSSSQTNLCSVFRTTGQGETLHPRPLISALDFREFLYNSRSNIAGLGKRILLAQADPWSAVEWEILPSWAEKLPPLGPILIGIWPKEVFPSVYRVRTVGDQCAAGNEEREGTVRTAAEGKDGILDGVATVAGDDGVDTESWVKLSAWMTGKE
jgi:hypothetical protein